MGKQIKHKTETRLEFFLKDLEHDKYVIDKFKTLFSDHDGNWKVVSEHLTLENGFQPKMVKKLQFTHELSSWSNENEYLVVAFQNDSKNNSMRDLALNFNKENLAKQITTVKAKPNAKEAKAYATELHNRLFQLEPTASLQRMLVDPKETPVSDKIMSGHLATFLGNQPEDFNIKITSVYEAFKEENAFKDIDPELQESIIGELKSLQRVAALSPTSKSLSVLLKTNLTSALRISELSEKQFVKATAKDLGENGEAVAKQLHRNAMNARIRNEQALMAIKEMEQGTGVSFIDKSLYKTSSTKINGSTAKKDKNGTTIMPYDFIIEELQKHNLSWDTLFGDADLCECGHCNSVYSAAAYFVELLQYLRNNNLDPDGTIKTDPRDISDTALEKLLERRPDLGCLELTCKNTLTVLPYVDLVNEVMENYMVYHHTKAFNVDDETSGELLAQPQHTEYDAYCILHKAVYPFTLPYHQPIDAARIYLEFLETSRHKLIDTFRSARKEKIIPVPEGDETTDESTETPTAEEKKILDKLHTNYIDRAVDAEFLGLTQEEYVILTKEAFVTKDYWDKQCKKEHTLEEYHTKIGLKPVHEYYGYATAEELLSTDEDTKQGLTFVKDQFLRRTGVDYIDLVELLKTQCLNPNMPQGKALSIMESILFSYRYLQTFLDNGASSPKGKYGKLIAFLTKVSPLLPLLEAILHPDPCNPKKLDVCLETDDLEKWVYCYFERIGKIIVLENGIPCIDGELISIPKGTTIYSPSARQLAIIRNCQIITTDDGEETIIGTVDKSSGLITLNPKTSNTTGDLSLITFVSTQGEQGKIIIVEGALYLVSERKNLPFSSGNIDTCSLETVRLIHLDGSPVTIEEYDRIHRFIRLWRKLNWTIDETDKALVGLGSTKETCNDDLLPDTDDCDTDCNELFENAYSCEETEGDIDCFNTKHLDLLHCDISPSFLHELVAIIKLIDLSGLELIKLLTFWTNISTSGEKSLYVRLFLTHNLRHIDSVFQANKNGNYLTNNAKISEHKPVLMAALNLSANDIDAIVEGAGIEDELILDNVTVLYHYRLLSKVLGLKIPDFISILPLFGNVFANAHTTLAFIKQWGKMEDAGFDHHQLNYIIRDYDHPKKPFTPSQKTILELAKTLYDGLNAIDETYKDFTEEDEVTSEIVRAKAILLFDQAALEKIIELLEGTHVFISNAPNNLEIDIPDDKSLKSKFNYDKEAGTIQITGILTIAETTDYNALSNDPNWIEALIRIEKQQKKLFKELLYDVFEAEKLRTPEREALIEEAEETLKKGDINIPLEDIPDGQEDTNTAGKKRQSLMQVFMPYLRQELTHRFVISTLAGMVDLEELTTDVLVSEILMTETSDIPIYSIFEAIKESAAPTNNDWKGYLIPSAGGDYTFIVKDSDTEPVISIDGKTIDFQVQEDPTNEWWSHIEKLNAGKLYYLLVSGIDLQNIYWKTSTSSISSIPTSMLLPDFASEACKPAFIKLKKAAILVSGFELSTDEVRYLNEHNVDFDGLDFNALKLPMWLRLEAYTRLRNSFPRTDFNILDFFNWTHENEDPVLLSEKIKELSLWEKARIDKLIAEDHFNITQTQEFYNEKNLLKLQNALKEANKIRMDLDLLFDWAKPTSNFKKCRKIAESIQNAIRAKYNQEDWEEVIKPLHDTLRNNQADALIAYLLQQPDLITWGVTDADGLFEYFLIDVQMDACMETSRIKQALSSVQLFIHRCFLGLEEEHNGITPDILDRGRWEWMQRYRVWEANRKVFLYPENWIESNLRDDKSPFFEELESELLQKDINKQNVKDALKSYLYKVDEVANMEVVGLYIEGNKSPDDLWSEGSKLHVFSRTRNAPYFFYYRYLELDSMNWYPWEKMQVDIPSYDVENSEHNILGSGCYLIPVVWNGRLLMFFPQFIKKTKPITEAFGSRSFTQLANAPDGINKSKPIEYWEIKMAISEYRNGKWTQKQISKDAINHQELSLPIIHLYEFMPIPDIDRLAIKMKYNAINLPDNQFGFEFDNGGSLRKVNTEIDGDNEIIVLIFHHTLNVIQSLQINNEVDNYKFNDATLTTYNSAKFHMPHSHDLLGKINCETLENFFAYNLQFQGEEKADAFGKYNDIYHELKRPYSLYNWELFFHTPMLLGDALSNSQQFEEAMKWYHFVFNPMSDGVDDKRFWQYRPFKEIEAQHILASIFNSLEPNKADDNINEWRGNPFKPHLVARSRPVAYMKWVVMKYIDNLVEWGDYLFRQDTIESINQATQLYVLAGHILGQRPQTIPKRGKIKPQTYNSLLDKWDAFSNAMVELELVAPYSNQMSLQIGTENNVVGLANIFGLASTLYFCIPNNPKLIGYWDTIADRLFKIRHCQNIVGVFRKLALFEPPIDPALLVRAAAQGLSIASVLNDLNTPMPNYRFYYLLQKALELCNELKSMGGAMLAAIEKKDNETMALIRAKHEGVMQNLVMEIKKQQLDEAEKALDGLLQNRKSPEHRMKYYLQLIGEDADKIPASDADFTELANAIEKPIDESGLKLIKYEKEEFDKSHDAHHWQLGANSVEALAAIFHALPDAAIAAMPLGVGGEATFGGSYLGNAASAASKVIQIISSQLSFESANAGKKGGFLRALQDRVMQANAAGLELKQIDKQILTQQIRIDIANQEIKNQQKLIDNANEIEEFLKNKYTNKELYVWMKGSLRTLYHQVYSLAYELSKKAEKVYRFERGLSTSDFIKPGYWDAGRDGLLAGEQLYVGLKQLEATHQENKGYDYEITKHISLRQINPLALIQLKEMGKCEFGLPEILFDMDYPGHYKRRIKSVSISIPCIVGPYTGLNASLRLLEHKFRNSAIAKNKNDYVEKTGESDDRFITFNIPVTAIAASSAQNESGMFELNFKDERYLPFEGAGAISKWRLELPDFRQFDYDTISDVIIHMRYMDSEGGERLKKAANETVIEFNKNNEELGRQEGLFSIVDLKHDLPNAWHKAMMVEEGDTERVITIKNIQDYLPYYVRLDADGKTREAKDIKITDVILTTDSDLQAAEIVLDQEGEEFNFTDGISVGNTKTFAIREEEIKAENFNVTIKNVDKEINKALMVVRFILK